MYVCMYVYIYIYIYIYDCTWRLCMHLLIRLTCKCSVRATNIYDVTCINVCICIYIHIIYIIYTYIFIYIYIYMTAHDVYVCICSSDWRACEPRLQWWVPRRGVPSADHHVTSQRAMVCKFSIHLAISAQAQESRGCDKCQRCPCVVGMLT